ncbi:MAG: polysaccharide deacetylase family protein [Deltaproteobacteria bacterium]|nr:polysaccharide deacetylase family protein [Deltaproteobacteria bacterium]
MLSATGISLVVLVAFLLRFNLWRRDIRGVPILMYHMISDDVSRTRIPKLRVSEKRFRAQMAYLHTKGYHPITLREWLGYRRGSGVCPPKPIIITFDDGYRNFYSTAWPILKKHGFKATVFLVTKYVGGSNVWDRAKGEPEEKLLNLDEIKTLSREGVEFGSHGHNHQDLTGIPLSEVESDVMASKSVLEGALKTQVVSFSYPYGKHNAKVRWAVKEAGFLAACVTQPGDNDKNVDPFQLKRIIVKRNDNLFDFKIKLRKGKSRI